MRLDRLTLKAQEAVQDSQRLADRHHHQQIDVDILGYGQFQPYIRFSGCIVQINGGGAVIAGHNVGPAALAAYELL